MRTGERRFASIPYSMIQRTDEETVDYHFRIQSSCIDKPKARDVKRRQKDEQKSESLISSQGSLTLRFS